MELEFYLNGYCTASKSEQNGTSGNASTAVPKWCREVPFSPGGTSPTRGLGGFTCPSLSLNFAIGLGEL